jgi:hypothetical protein
VFSVPVVLLTSAEAPSAVLELPVFEKSDSNPLAVLLLPEAFSRSASVPHAELNPPVVSENRACSPNAALLAPVLSEARDWYPLAVFPVPVVELFPANPRKTSSFDAEPKANAIPPRSNWLEVLIVPFTSSLAPGDVVPMPMSGPAVD